jgi:ATP-dependent protease ClpP protease subunit
MSAASFIATCCTKGHRYISKNSFFMVHQPIGSHDWMKQSDEGIWQRYWDRSYTRMFTRNTREIPSYLCAKCFITISQCLRKRP